MDAEGNVYVTDSGNNRVQKFANNGTFLRRWGGLGPGNGQFSYPSGIAVDSAGSVYVSDGKSRIQAFTADGTYVTTINLTDVGDGLTRAVREIAIDSVDNIYLADSNTARVLKIDCSGTVLRTVNEVPGLAEGGFLQPERSRGRWRGPRLCR